MEKIIVAFESEKTALRVKELLEGGRRGRLLGVPHRRPGAAGHKQAASAGGGVRLQAGGSDGGAVL